METKEFQRLIVVCSEFSELFPGQIIFIGGIAIYLHTIHVKNVKKLAETTHDADFYISLAAMGDLRDLEEVTPNARLSKHQVIKSGFEFDIYTERHAKLIVPFSDVSNKAMRYEPFYVACLEHLLALKLEAYGERKNSSKGIKDAKDIIRIGLCAKSLGFSKNRYLLYKMNTHEKWLEEIIKSPAAIGLAQGNSHTAKTYRESVKKLLTSCR